MTSESSSPLLVQFYLSSLWSWLPEGRTRILEALESCQVAQARFGFDEKHDSLQIQCLEDDKEYIMSEYLKAQSEMEDELRDKEVILDDGNLIPTIQNNLIDTARPKAAAPEDSEDTEVAATTGHSPGRRAPGQGQQSPSKSATGRGQRSPVRHFAAYGQQSPRKRAADQSQAGKQNEGKEEDEEDYHF